MTKFLKIITCVTIIAFAGLIMAISGTFLYLSPQLPAVERLTDIKLQIPLRIYTQEGQLMGEFGDKRRNPIKRAEIPEPFIQAFLAAEDDQFYQHPGVSIKGLARAVLQMLSGSNTQTGGSTITMQVAKNYFLTPERTIIRKLREMFLALQIEQELSKDEILELYVNKIFLGHRAYGIGAAAQVYYGKHPQELDLAQMAMIAGLPKAPSDYNPLTNPVRALQRRDWILKRMLKLGYINQEQLATAIAQPSTAVRHDVNIDVNAPYAAEMARKYALDAYGESAYTEGYRVITTINGEFQKAANRAINNGLMAYDSRHGMRKKEDFIKKPNEENKAAFFKQARNYGNLIPAIVVDIKDNIITVELANNNLSSIDLGEQLEQLRPYIDANSLGSIPETAANVVKVGDVVRLKALAENSYALSQIPNAEAALVALNPNNGAILSLVGGFDFYKSKFNRSTQAARQVGSNIKPFVYAAAIENGFTPATIINDAPVVFNDEQLESSWRPDNSDSKFLGPTRLRKALYLSRNLVSIRILRQTGIETTRDYISRFGLGKYQLAKDLSLALGSSAFSPLDMAQAYATFANQGFAVKPFLIAEVYDSSDSAIYSANPATVCKNDEDCTAIIELANETDNAPLDAADTLEQATAAELAINKAPRIISKQVAFLMDDMLKDVVRRGTGYKAKKALQRNDLAGKTGTTNGPTDAWFSGYNRDIVTAVWLGFDDNSNLGRREYGGSAALPIWVEFMETALKDSPEVQNDPPEGIISVLIDSETGKQARPGSSNTLFEYIQESQLESIKADDNSSGVTPVNLEELFQ